MASGTEQSFVAVVDKHQLTMLLRNAAPPSFQKSLFSSIYTETQTKTGSAGFSKVFVFKGRKGITVAIVMRFTMKMH